MYNKLVKSTPEGVYMNGDWCDIPLEIGTTDQGDVLLMSEEERKLHMHMIGTTGTGKTKFLERLIRQDIDKGQGVCVIDPTGNLYNNLVRWCETHYIQEERDIILIDPTENEWVSGFNPLSSGGGTSTEIDLDEIAFVTAATRSAIQRAWGDSKKVPAPQLRRLLNLLLYTLLEHQLTIPEGQLLMNPDPKSLVRSYLTKTLQNPTAINEWESVATIKPYEYESLFGSVRNRLFDFLLQPRLAAMVSQGKAIDFRRAMDEGQVILINLSTGGKKIDPDIGKLIGAFVVNSIVLAARGRSDIPEEERRPFYLYIDECHRYLNDDIAEILDELRQFRLHLILAHQNLLQIREDGSERIAAAIMAQARTKVVFQCPEEDDADRMAKRIFRGDIDLEEPKHAFDKPTPTGEFHTKILHGQSDGESIGSPGQTITHTAGADSGEISHSVTSNEGMQATSSVSTSHETLVPEYAVMPTTPYSLQEQYERKAANIATLRARHAIVKLPEEKACEITTPAVEEGYAGDERVKRFKQQAYERYDFIVPRVEADNARQDRLELLQRRAIDFRNGHGLLLDGKAVDVEEFDPCDNG